MPVRGLETYATMFFRTAVGCVLLTMSSLKQWRPRLCESSLAELAISVHSPLLPAYNKYMGGVDRLSQVRKTYGFEQY